MLQQHELSTDLVDLPEFDAFFACATKTRSGFGGGGVGIHGTAAFARRTVAVPVKAEAGLTYRSAVESAGLFGLVGAYPPGIALRKKEESLEQDGRRIILDFGLFVLINVCVACRFTFASSASLPYTYNRLIALVCTGTSTPKEYRERTTQKSLRTSSNARWTSSHFSTVESRLSRKQGVR